MFACSPNSENLGARSPPILLQLTSQESQQKVLVGRKVTDGFDIVDVFEDLRIFPYKGIAPLLFGSNDHWNKCTQRITTTEQLTFPSSLGGGARGGR